MKSRDLATLKKIVAEDPGDPAFYELAKALSAQKKTLRDAQLVAQRGINANPSHLKARLLLAKIYYSQELIEFAVRELLELYRQSNNETIKELIESFGTVGSEYLEAYSSIFGMKVSKTDESDSEVLAEIKIEQDFDEVLGSLDNKD